MNTSYQDHMNSKISKLEELELDKRLVKAESYIQYLSETYSQLGTEIWELQKLNREKEEIKAEKKLKFKNTLKKIGLYILTVLAGVGTMAIIRSLM